MVSFSGPSPQPKYQWLKDMKVGQKPVEVERRYQKTMHSLAQRWCFKVGTKAHPTDPDKILVWRIT